MSISGKMKNNTPGVIIIGGHIQGLGIARVFGKHSIPCILLDDKHHNLAKHSKYIIAFHHYSKDGLLNCLLNLQKQNKYHNWLLFPTRDLHVAILSKNKEILNNHFTVSSDDWSVISKCYNKRETYTLAAALQIPIPKTWMPISRDELNEIELPFPCIIKPAIMHIFYESFGKKVFICRNRAELYENYDLSLNVIPSNEVIIQEIIPGLVNNQFSACFTFNRDEFLVSLCAMRRRQHPLSFGHATTYAETIQNPGIMQLAVKLLKHINYRGICEVEFMYDARDNTYKFLEINPRTWKWHIIAEKANTPFLTSLYALLMNDEKIIHSGWEQAAFRHFITDLPTMLKLKMKGIYIKPEKRPIQSAVWDNADIRPALFELLYLPYNIFTR